MTITALCIVKNEEKNIEQSINSYKNAVDEIIIVDTGSTDNTKEICKNLGCKIFDFEWTDDFSEARNFALSKATGDWILFLDADEYFLHDLDKNFKYCLIELENNNVDMLKILTYNIDKNTNKQLHTSYGLKIFKNYKNFKYKNAIHEVLDYPCNTLGSITNEFAIIHTGYSSNIISEKPKRNLNILKQKEKNNKELLTTSDYFYLMRESLSLNLYDEAKKYRDILFNRKDFYDFIHSMDIGYLSYIYSYHIMCKENLSFDEKLNFLLEALNNVDVPEIYYNIAVLYLKKDYKKSHEYLIKAIQKNNDLINIERFSTYCSYEPNIYYLLAKIEFTNKNYDNALRHSVVSCMLDKQNTNYLGLLLRICSKFKPKKVYNILLKTYNPKTKDDYEFLVNNLVNTDLYEVFKKIAITYNVEYGGGDTAVFMAMILDKQYEIATKTAYTIYKNTNDNYYIFILMIILLYADKKELYNKYYICLDNTYKDIINSFINKENKITKEEYHIYVDIMIRLLYLDCDRFIKTVDMNLINNDDLMRVIIVLESMGKYKYIINIIEKMKNIKDVNIIGYYLNALYFTNKKNKLYSVYEYYTNNGMDLNNYEYLINLKQ